MDELEALRKELAEARKCRCDNKCGLCKADLAKLVAERDKLKELVINLVKHSPEAYFILGKGPQDFDAVDTMMYPYWHTASEISK